MIVLALAAKPASAQSLVTGYYQNVPLWSDTSSLSQGGFSDFNRIRLSTAPVFGRFSVELAYEQVLTLRGNDTSSEVFIGGVPGGGEWLDLQWTLDESKHVLWQHRFDRMRIGFKPSDKLQIDVGRQAVSWATALFLTPADPFSPFNPADPFREFRAGVDAARVRVYPGPLSEIDVVVRPTKTAVGEELTALARGLTTLKGWELSGWAGSLYGDVSGAGGVSGSLRGWALRGEAVVREVATGGAVFRGSFGVDRLFPIRGKDLFLVVEVQHDGFGAGDASQYSRVLDSDPFRRGELQVLGRNEAVLQASYQLHPLFSLAGLALWNMSDGSGLVSPSFSYSASNEATITGGLFVGIGEAMPSGNSPIPSEYGAVPTTAYVSVSLFF